ncbi:TetR family transcriptional regulator [Aeromonas sp. CU5]|uniref:TetR/AcrR family transcriptional regulator n=1 Tax=Aeromonas sp. CU5 TaxID=2033033 RepID=UPI000BFE6F23|nr:TetR/AcrR family transcriptional regulator [Aeromonas sp. CU5]ATL93411.1 TetR family transcriptional regulator [Aeromonas sp. CU5]
MSKGRLTRETILQTAFEQASQQGLESLTIGSLASACEMSKSGLFAHFQSRDNLQIAVLEYAAEVFRLRVIQPVRQQEHQSQHDKLIALLRAWQAWNHCFAGRCMFLDAWTSAQDGHEQTSQVQQAARQLVRFWLDYLARQVVQGQATGEWRQEMDPWRAVYRLYGLYLADQVFNDLELCQDSAHHFWPEVDVLLSSWR